MLCFASVLVRLTENSILLKIVYVCIFAMKKKKLFGFLRKIILKFSDADCPTLTLDIFQEFIQSILGLVFAKILRNEFIWNFR